MICLNCDTLKILSFISFRFSKKSSGNISQNFLSRIFSQEIFFEFFYDFEILIVWESKQISRGSTKVD